VDWKHRVWLGECLLLVIAYAVVGFGFVRLHYPFTRERCWLGSEISFVPFRWRCYSSSSRSFVKIGRPASPGCLRYQATLSPSSYLYIISPIWSLPKDRATPNDPHQTRYRRFPKTKFGQNGRNDLLGWCRRCSTFRPETFGARIDSGMAR